MSVAGRCRKLDRENVDRLSGYLFRNSNITQAAVTAFCQLVEAGKVSGPLDINIFTVKCFCFIYQPRWLLKSYAGAGRLTFRCRNFLLNFSTPCI